MTDGRYQLIAYLDLLGFSNYYAYIKKIEMAKRDEKTAFAFFNILYRKYIDRLIASVNLVPRNISSDNDEKNILSTLSESIQVLPISDSIIIAVDCESKTIMQAYWLVSFMLLLTLDEMMKADFIQDEIKKLGFSIFNPIRGGMSFGLSETNLTKSPPFIFSVPYNEAYEIEKGKSCWPRITLSDSITQQVKDTYIGKISLSYDAEIKLNYFDPLKFKYFFFAKSKAVNLPNKQDRIALVSKFAQDYKFYVELNAKGAAVLYHDLIKNYDKDGEKRAESLLDKYKKWILYYNDRIRWLIENDTDFNDCHDLLISDEIYNYYI